jgi:hypothetical protein
MGKKTPKLSLILLHGLILVGMLAQKIRTTDIILTCNFEKINHSFLALN